MTQKEKQYSDERLNAYIDGEMPAAEAAALLRHLAGDQHLATRVSELTLLKSMVRDHIPEVVLCTPDLDRIYRANPKKPQAAVIRRLNNFRQTIAGITPMRALAATVAAVMLIGALGWLWQSQSSEADIITAAVRHHHSWMDMPKLPDPQGKPILASFIRNNKQIFIPDLGDSKLSIERIERFGGDGIHVGYIGVHNCRLSFFVLPAMAPDTQALMELQVADSRVFKWRKNRLEYLVLAVGMDPSRLKLIAQVVYNATRTMQPFDQRTRMALNLNHQFSKTCAG